MAKEPIFLPMESYIRELDARILLACCAAKRGRDSYLGSTSAFNSNLWRLPRGVLFAKAMTRGSLKPFRNAKNLGNTIVSWDEEAIVHYPPDLYFPRRIDFRTLKYVSKIFAWGQENIDLWSGHPEFPMRSVVLTGNPRADLLKPPIREAFSAAAVEITKKHGDFVLVNTNFSNVNCDLRTLNLKYKDPNEPRKYLYGATAKGLPQSEVDALFEYRNKIFLSFQEMIPAVATALPNLNFVVRPHFSESLEYWKKLLRGIPNVKVIREGNVVPWLCAAKLLIHNGCTTAVEAYGLGLSAIAFEAVKNSKYKLELPNELSHRSDSINKVSDLAKRLVIESASARTPERDRLFQHYIFDREQGLATDAILSELDLVRSKDAQVSRLKSQLGAWLGEKNPFRKTPKFDARKTHKMMKFPVLDALEIKARTDAMCKILGMPPVEVKDIGRGLVCVRLES